MATDLNYIKYVVEQIDLPDISFKKCLANIWYIIKPCPFYLFATTVFLSRFWKKQPRFLVKFANKSFHMTAPNCITCWILIIPILQGKRLLPYIIAEKTSQRNQNSNVFICPSFRAFLFIFSYCCAVFRKECSLWKRVVFCLPGIKIKIINIWWRCKNGFFCLRGK